MDYGAVKKTEFRHLKEKSFWTSYFFPTLQESSVNESFWGCYYVTSLQPYYCVTSSPCPWQGTWNLITFNVPYNSNHTVVLWFLILVSVANWDFSKEKISLKNIFKWELHFAIWFPSICFRRSSYLLFNSLLKLLLKLMQLGIMSKK